MSWLMDEKERRWAVDKVDTTGRKTEKEFFGEDPVSPPQFCIHSRYLMNTCYLISWPLKYMYLSGSYVGLPDKTEDTQLNLNVR